MFHRDSLISGGLRSSQKLGAHVAPQGRCWLAKPQVLETFGFIVYFYLFSALPKEILGMGPGYRHPGVRRSWVPNLYRGFI